MVIYSIAMLNSQRVSTGWMKRMTERDPWNWMLPQHVQRPGCLCCDVPSCQGKHYWHLRKIHPGPKGLASQFDHHDSRVPFFGDNFLRRLLVSKARDLGDLGLPPQAFGRENPMPEKCKPCSATLFSSWSPSHLSTSFGNIVGCFQFEIPSTKWLSKYSKVV